MITGEYIPLDARLALIDIMMAAGVQSCEITSVARIPAEQAAAMWENLNGPPPLKGIAAERHLYLEPGNRVIDVYEQNSSLPAAQVIALMTARIIEIGPGLVSHHCGDPSKITVFDIGPSTVKPPESLPAFEAALTEAVKDGRLSKFLSPSNGDPALHIERLVKQESAVIS